MHSCVVYFLCSHDESFKGLSGVQEARAFWDLVELFAVSDLHELDPVLQFSCQFVITLCGFFEKSDGGMNKVSCKGCVICFVFFVEFVVDVFCCCSYVFLDKLNFVFAVKFIIFLLMCCCFQGDWCLLSGIMFKLCHSFIVNCGRFCCV